MIRQPKQEQLNRLVVKSQQQVFIARAREGLRASLFQAHALADLVKEVYFPWLSQPEAIQAGQLAMSAVSADEPGHKPLNQCKMVPVVLTLCAGEEDYRYDRRRDCCRCLAGARLAFRFRTHELGRDIRYYTTPACATCKLRTKCTRNGGGRLGRPPESLDPPFTTMSASLKTVIHRLSNDVPCLSRAETNPRQESARQCLHGGPPCRVIKYSSCADPQ